MADKNLVNRVWGKGHPVPGRDPRISRKDDEGNLIDRHLYGMRSGAGWEIDHIVPDARGGSDDLSNLRPLHWQANAARGGRM